MNGVPLRSTNVDNSLQNRRFQCGAGKVHVVRRHIVEDLMIAIQPPLPWRVKLLKHIFNEKARTERAFVQSTAANAGRRSPKFLLIDLETAPTQSHNMRFPIDILHPPLQVSPEVLWKQEYNRLLRFCPPLLCECFGIVMELDGWPFFFLAAHVNVTFAAHERILGVVVGVTRPRLALSIYEKLREGDSLSTKPRQAASHNPVLIGFPTALQFPASAQRHNLSGIGKIGDGTFKRS